MKARITVFLKPGVLDPAARAIHHALHGLGFEGVEAVRQSRSYELDVAEGTSEEELAEMARKLLANTVIENFRVERL